MTTKEKAACVFIRFGTSLFQACKNTLTKRLSITENYSGKVVGLVQPKNIQVLEGEWCNDKAMAILYFQTLTEAKRWEHSTPELRQQDWLGGTDIVIVPVDGCFDHCAKFFTLMTVCFESGWMPEKDPELIKSVQEQMAKFGVNNIINNKDAERARGNWNTAHLVVSQCKSCNDYKQFKEHDCVKRFTEKRQEYHESNLIVFNVEPLK